MRKTVKTKQVSSDKRLKSTKEKDKRIKKEETAK